jgi:HEAT repeat protein
MNILDKLSSQVGDRTEAANKRVSARVLKDPALLADIERGLLCPDVKVVGDCAEVMALVATEKPELVAPYAGALIARLDHKDTRVRWEAMHALAEIAALVPDKIARLVPRLVEKIANDESVIVRDHAIRALGGYGGTSKRAARQVWLPLRQALTAWEGKHAGKVLEAMQRVVAADATLERDARKIARQFAEDKRATVRAAAKRLAKPAV